MTQRPIPTLLRDATLQARPIRPPVILRCEEVWCPFSRTWKKHLKNIQKQVSMNPSNGGKPIDSASSPILGETHWKTHWKNIPSSPADHFGAIPGHRCHARDRTFTMQKSAAVNDGIYGFIWIYMDLYGFIWIYMDLYGFIWIYMDLYGFIWIYMDLYGFIDVSPENMVMD